MYGIKLFDKSGKDLTSIITPIFYLEASSPQSGSRNYGEIPVGKTLQYMATILTVNRAVIGPTVTISGSSVTWSNLVGLIVFYWGK